MSYKRFEVLTGKTYMLVFWFVLQHEDGGSILIRGILFCSMSVQSTACFGQHSDHLQVVQQLRFLLNCESINMMGY
jgi:hypothetical protein